MCDVNGVIKDGVVTSGGGDDCRGVGVGRRRGGR